MRRFPFLIAALVLTLGIATAASPLDKAKQEGLIGERPDGYVGFVVKEVPAEVKQLVDRTNEERRTEYEKVAKKNGTSIDAVQAIFGQKLIARQPSGTYVMTADGQWIKK